MTADHATGGLTIEDVPNDEACPEPLPGDERECQNVFYEDGPFEEKDGGRFWLDWTSVSHTADDVPVTAIGPRAGDLAGYYENTHIFVVMRDAMALGE